MGVWSALKSARRGDSFGARSQRAVKNQNTAPPRVLYDPVHSNLGGIHAVGGRAIYKIEQRSARNYRHLQEKFMKLLSVVHTFLIDCGKASKKTRGSFSGVFSEAGGPPFNRYNL
jgi:hypothetical protein